MIQGVLVGDSHIHYHNRRGPSIEPVRMDLLYPSPPYLVQLCGLISLAIELTTGTTYRVDLGVGSSQPSILLRKNPPVQILKHPRHFREQNGELKLPVDSDKPLNGIMIKMSSHSLPIPDQSHINKVRDSLWSRPFAGASVMIGSGFSRNADKPSSEVVDLPLWSDITAEIVRTLRPELEVPVNHDPLRLAQQYKSTFGRSDLHRLLGQLVRDMNFLPGETHSRLLKLPWRDVFTTNWDTLLERASRKVPEPSYGVVEDLDQLPLVSQPRIIKLHGSLPSKFPLIVTEEDYRTYPMKYAPFVNTVQQAMMETIFCLIGFSGDDPNFLNWSAWVRDNLGEAAPKIYLAGLLKLSPHQRRTLEERGVVPIDLWHHPKAKKWPEHLQHQYATQWILQTLEYGEPYDEKLWPLPLDERESNVDPRLTPIMKVPFETPVAQPLTQLSRASSAYDHEELEAIKEVVKAWSHNRRLYPGWLVFPSGEERFELTQHTDHWEPHIIGALRQLTLTERIFSIRELVWRREILLEPITAELAEAAQDVLNAFDFERRVIPGNGECSIDWPSVREAWRNIALMLVTDARYDCDESLFERRLMALDQFCDDSPDVAHRVQQERCLWALYSSAFHRLNELLDEWQIDNSDPIWMLRKAALLTEMHRHNESSSLLQEAVNSIRKDFALDRSIANASRLGWALGSTMTWSNRRSVYRRWDELASQKCHAWNEIDQITRSLTGTDQRNDAPSFDLGVSHTTTVSWSNKRHTRLVSAYRALRLPEVAGLPPVTIDSERGDIPIGLASNILTLAADELAPYAPELAIRMILRIGRYEGDKTFLSVFSRTRIASLSEDATDTLARICISVIDYILPRLVTPDEARGAISSVERLRVALEALSRLILRVKHGLVVEALALGLKCYRTKGFADHRLLVGPLGSLLKRSWEALPRELRSGLVFELLTAPIPGLDGFSAVTECEDPGSLVKHRDLPTNEMNEYKARRSEVISLALRALRSSNIATRNVATIRLFPVLLAGSVADDEALEIADALWRDSDPVLSNSSGPWTPFDWVFMLLPEISPGQAEQSFRRKWLAPQTIGEHEQSGYAQRMLAQLGPAIAAPESRERLLPLTEEESDFVAGQIVRFVESLFGSSVTLNSRVNISYLNVVIGAIRVPRTIAEGLFKVTESVLGIESIQKRDPLQTFADPLYDLRIAIGFSLIPGLVRTLSDRVDTMVMWLSSGLASTEEIRVSNAMLATRTWALMPEDTTPSMVPDSLIREVGAIIASRRKDALGEALLCATLIFERGIQSHKDTIATFALHGLSYLAEEMEYARYLDYDDAPTVRLLCVQLAIHLAKSGFGDNAIVVKWMEIGRNDPFPEVRNVVLFHE